MSEIRRYQQTEFSLIGDTYPLHEYAAGRYLPDLVEQTFVLDIGYIHTKPGGLGQLPDALVCNPEVFFNIIFYLCLVGI